jgi:hypothetical protein
MSSNEDIIAHILVSITTGLVFFYFWPKRNLKIFLFTLNLALLGGLWIDFDHLFDYFHYYGWQFNLQDFFKADYFRLSGKNFIPLHAFEYVAILIIIAKMQKEKIKKLSFSLVAVTILLHLLTDIGLFRIPPQNYSIIYRIATNFTAK